MYYRSANELAEYLILCGGSIAAGNNSLLLRNEVEEIVTMLFGQWSHHKDQVPHAICIRYFYLRTYKQVHFPVETITIAYEQYPKENNNTQSVQPSLRSP